MGLEITCEDFRDEDFSRFAQKLDSSLVALKKLLDRPGFGVGQPSIGAELELHLVDRAARPCFVNRQVLRTTLDDRVTLEVTRFNLETNTHPVRLAGKPFTELCYELTSILEKIRASARKHQARLAIIGILPTLESRDLNASSLTQTPRYRALAKGMRRLRSEPFRVSISGEDTLFLEADDVSLEGANASFQLHLRVDPRDFARTFNAAQLATGPALSIAGNSPLFLGRKLWDETRVALFRQSVDDRMGAVEGDWRPARVSFGHGWVREGAFELFAESVRLHEPVLPVLTPEEPERVVDDGGVPALRELRLHHGTVWRWNRAVYDEDLGGHLRIELRALPAGPTVPDMIANAAFHLGLTLGLADQMDDIMSGFAFGHARHNFYEAAQYGLLAKLLWPAPKAPSPVQLEATNLALRLLPLAALGLSKVWVEQAEIEHWLGLIRKRIEARVTGALWQRRAYSEALSSGSWQARAAAMLEAYIACSESEAPVHDWPEPS